MKLFSQSLALVSAFVAISAIIWTPLDDWKAPILGFVIVLSVIGIIIKQRAMRKKTDKPQDIFTGSNIEVFMVTVALFLIIFMTGGLSSTLYFLIYFLLFGIVFVFKPETVFILLLGIFVVFFNALGNGDLMSNLIRLGSVAFLAPISYFFGREFNKREELEKKVEDTTGQILEDAQTLLDRTKNEDAVNEIDDIIERTNELRKEADKE